MTQQFTWDHTVEFVDSLTRAQDTLAKAGLTARYGGRHVGHGTENSLAYFTDNYVEFLGLYDRDEALHETLAHGQIFREAGELLPGYIGFYRAALHVHDSHAAARRLTSQGLKLGEIVPGNRTTADGTEIRWQLLWIEGDDHGLRYPFVIDWGADERTQLQRYEHSGLLHQHAIGEVNTVRAVFEVPDPQIIANHWSQLFDLQLHQSGSAFELNVGSGRFWRFVQGERNGIAELQFAAPAGRSFDVTIGQARFRSISAD